MTTLVVSVLVYLAVTIAIGLYAAKFVSNSKDYLVTGGLHGDEPRGFASADFPFRREKDGVDSARVRKWSRVCPQ